ncbi:hypothetical protein pipiens_010336 [Culex pipiens pipiens]|uniref:Uncharacterized protein n=1 Tax=Culex pipiens pipiens TaxID=38569 RepID=A0ABD1DB74_CULPP
MAPSLSKIAANPNVAIAIAGCTAATWIILYGKQVRQARQAVRKRGIESGCIATGLIGIDDDSSKTAV